MAVLPDTDRERIWRGLMRWWSNLQEPLAGITKAELRAAINAADSWMDDNTASFVSALPDPFRTNSTQSQKWLLFLAVALMRCDLDKLKRLFGEVD
jgi:hypothetical protein